MYLAQVLNSRGRWVEVAAGKVSPFETIEAALEYLRKWYPDWYRVEGQTRAIATSAAAAEDARAR